MTENEIQSHEHLQVDNTVECEKIVAEETENTIEDVTDTFTPFIREPSGNYSSISPFCRQIIAVTPTCIAFMQGGMTMGHSATMLPQLKQAQEQIPIDDYTGSWIASVIGLSMVPSCVISGFILDKYGRKPAIFISSLFYPIGWTLIALAKNLPQILMGRIFIGAGYGFIGPAIGIYIGEVTDPKNRSFISVLTYVSMALGVLLVHCCDIMTHWKWTACLCGLISLTQTAITLFIPESPVWLISKNRHKEATEAFVWLRGMNNEASKELKVAIKKQDVRSKKTLNLKEQILLLITPQFLKPLFILLVLFVMSQCSGLNHLVFYAVDIIKISVKGNVDNNLVMVSIDSVRVVISAISCVINKKYSRRSVFFVSAISSAISLLGLIAYLYSSKMGIVTTPWISITCIILFMIFISIGVVPLPGISCAELFPINLREIGNTISVCWCYLMVFLVAKLTPTVFGNFGALITFGSCVLIIFVGSILIYLFLPETKGKTLQEIQDNFKTWH